MPDLVYGSAAIEQARVAVASEARRVPALADLLPTVPAGAFGGLEGAADFAAALTRLREALAADLAAGGARLDQVDRALDATLRSMQSTDHAAASSLTPGSPTPGGR